MSKMKLGVFDSGIGGEAVAQELAVAFPSAHIMSVNDHEHVPYGDRKAEDITRLTDAAIQPLLTAHCDVIIIACNSATAAAIEILRQRYPTQLFIGLEPMVKPAAAMTRTGTIAVCATPATLGSVRYHRLRDTYTKNVTVIEPDCSSWARLIENNELNEAEVETTVETLLEQNADVIVLACTHYHWIRETIAAVTAGRAQVIDPSEAIVRQVKALLERR
jgi:glutamate racemase